MIKIDKRFMNLDEPLTFPAQDIYLKSYTEASTAAIFSSGVLVINLASGSVFTVTLSQTCTNVAVSNVPASGMVGSFTLILTQGSPANTVAWPAAFKFSKGTDPVITTASAIYILTFFTKDGGTNWYGFAPGNEMS
jgi:hypothetical protein